MRISGQKLAELKQILKHQYGLSLTDEQAQQIGFQIMLLILAKSEHEQSKKKRVQ